MKKMLAGLVFISLVLLLGTNIVFAQTKEYTLLEPLPCLSPTDPGCKDGVIEKFAIEGYIAYAYNLFVGLAAVAAVFMIVWGGFQYMTTDSINDKKEGMGKVKNALYGLLLVLCTYLLIQTINPKLVIVPKTLVPKLAIQDNRFTANGQYLNQLIREMDRYGSQVTELTERARLSHANADALQAQADDVEAEIAEATRQNDSERLAKLQLERENIYTQLDKEESAIIAASRQAFLARTVQNAGEDAEDKQINIQQYLDAAKTSYEGGMAELAKISNPPDTAEAKRLSDAYNYARGILLIQKHVIDSGTTFKSVLGGSSAVLGTVLDNAIYTETMAVFNSYQRGSTSARAFELYEDINKDVVVGIAPQISDLRLRNQLINAANQGVQPQ